jgi:hypothetical protein
VYLLFERGEKTPGRRPLPPSVGSARQTDRQRQSADLVDVWRALTSPLGIRIASAHRTATLNTTHRRLPPHTRPLHLVAAHVLALLATLCAHLLAECLPLAAHVLALLATLCAHLLAECLPLAAHVLAVLATLCAHLHAERLSLAAHVLAVLATLRAHLHALAAPHALTATHALAATLPKSDGRRQCDHGQDG